MPLHSNADSTLGDRPDCPGTVLEHVDGTEGACSTGTACTGGDHTAATYCDGVEEQCPHCRTLRCEHAVIEHENGAEECCGLGTACSPGNWHAGELIACEEVYDDVHVCPPERPLPGEVPAGVRA